MPSKVANAYTSGVKRERLPMNHRVFFRFINHIEIRRFYPVQGQSWRLFVNFSHGSFGLALMNSCHVHGKIL